MARKAGKGAKRGDRMGEAVKKPIKLDKVLIEKLLGLKELVENLSSQSDIALRGGVYKELASADILTVSHDNWIIGYKVFPGLISNINRIFVKVEGYLLAEVPDIESNPVMMAIFDVFLDRQQESPTIEMIASDALKIEQICVPLTSRMPIINKIMQ